MQGREQPGILFQIDTLSQLPVHLLRPGVQSPITQDLQDFTLIDFCHSCQLPRGTDAGASCLIMSGDRGEGPILPRLYAERIPPGRGVASTGVV